MRPNLVRSSGGGAGELGRGGRAAPSEQRPPAQRSAPSPEQLFFDARAAATQLLQAWDAYQQVMADFLDEFEVSFMEGYEGEVEKTRGFVYEATMALATLRTEARARGLFASRKPRGGKRVNLQLHLRSRYRTRRYRIVYVGAPARR